MSKVSKKEVMDAIEYFWQAGYIDELTSDKRYYTKILLDCCANKYKIELEEWANVYTRNKKRKNRQL